MSVRNPRWSGPYPLPPLWRARPHVWTLCPGLRARPCRSPPSRRPERSAGLSPRVRGAHNGARIALDDQRFIPAGAGNTPGTSATSTKTTVHPRGCGEHFLEANLRALPAGSSPRVRGTHERIKGRWARARFIPAGAGNTGGPATRRSAPAVHPRGCGEHGLYGQPAAASGGSSPRVRGTPKLEPGARPQIRFIPAGAGNTIWLRFEAPPITVHPRGCGEHSTANGDRNGQCGSSPRVRGTRGAGRGRWCW